MSNSNMVVHTHLSPMNSGLRNQQISKITIHYMAGNLSIETCGNVFQTREASSNYGIGSDGRVGMYVEEKNRSWASSSPWNDNRAVTIEVANINSDGVITDKAMESLIDLCVDICRRNGIDKLTYTGDKNGSLTMHCFFANTPCPGNYLKSKFPWIAQEVTRRLSGETSSSAATNTNNRVSVPDVVYCVRTAESGWLPEVYNLNDYAGIKGQKITDIAINFTKEGASGWYQVHTISGVWLPAVTWYDISDDVNGYAGNHTPIDAVRCYYNTPERIANDLGYLCATYRVSPVNCGYYDWQKDDSTGSGMDGYAGCFGTAIDRFQLVLSK